MSVLQYLEATDAESGLTSRRVVGVIVACQLSVHKRRLMLRLIYLLRLLLLLSLLLMMMLLFFVVQFDVLLSDGVPRGRRRHHGDALGVAGGGRLGSGEASGSGRKLGTDGRCGGRIGGLGRGIECIGGRR